MFCTFKARMVYRGMCGLVPSSVSLVKKRSETSSLCQKSSLRRCLTTDRSSVCMPARTHTHTHTHTHTDTYTLTHTHTHTLTHIRSLSLSHTHTHTHTHTYTLTDTYTLTHTQTHTHTHKQTHTHTHTHVQSHLYIVKVHFETHFTSSKNYFTMPFFKPIPV